MSPTKKYPNPLEEALESLGLAIEKCKQAEVKIDAILAQIAEIERAMAEDDTAEREARFDAIREESGDGADDHGSEHGDDERRSSRGE